MRVRCPDPTTDKLLLRASSLDKFEQLVKERARDASDGSFSSGLQGFFDKASLFGSESFPLRGSFSVSGLQLVLGYGACVTLRKGRRGRTVANTLPARSLTEECLSSHLSSFH